MSRLHHIRVRRARGLPAPLPPTPKRPLGPPFLFGFRDVAIRTRADAIEASGSWEEFLDDIADVYVSEPGWLPHKALSLIERLVPPAEMQAHRNAMRARIEERQEANLAGLREILDDARGGREARRSLFDRLFRRAA